MGEFSDQITYTTITEKEYRGSYWGSQEPNNYPYEIQQFYLPQCDRYVDLTAGGGAYPYHLAYQGFEVVVNDRNLYASTCLESVFACRLDKLVGVESDWFEFFCKFTHPTIIYPKQGYLYNNSGDTGQARFNFETASYIDGLCHYTHPLILASVARTIVSNYTFRALSWSTKAADNKQWVDQVSPIDFWIKLCRTAYRIHYWAHLLHPTLCRVFNVDALNMCQSSITMNEAFVYTDPAWPWAQQKDNENPYKFLTDEISPIIRGDRSSLKTKFWSMKDPDTIYNDVRSWMHAAFANGAKYFCLSTQGTNFPDPSNLYSELAATFEFEDCWVRSAASQSQGQKEFTEHFAIFSGVL